ncbi:GAF domain-containing protein [Paludibacterium purpuratum]|uniref:Putative methionine-R-sulfoxide reductase with GAF domain n=1 Tax=Paludibacterium purpuratum TaxID=1144873 RepID=A0A4R7AYE9_9NEIS|nr:GAF domain-containing protein [Paludibacterium purpuratum]TDR71446.1 putative methionine-R-sulfoxide reductase with GAF domain [Paludibacterium purpuratum]
MIAAQVLKAYLREQSLELDQTEVQVAAITLASVLMAQKPIPARDLFRFPVPVLGENGACSLVDELSDEPYDLSVWFGGDTDEARAALAELVALIDSTNRQIGADWLGIYVVRGEGESARLVKMAYHGRPSRAEFPLTEAFADVSNNSRVGLSGWGVVIEDVAEWRALGGSYYQCDPTVRSEVCLPVLDDTGRVLGIIDAEASERGFFDPARQAWLVALAVVLAKPLASLPFVEAE